MNTLPPRSIASRWIASALTVIVTLALAVTAYTAVERIGASSTSIDGQSTVGSEAPAGAELEMGTATSTHDHDDHSRRGIASGEATFTFGAELTDGDGYIADGESLSPFDAARPAIANLDADLLAAVRRATVEASDEGIALVITSGWRSTRYQQSLLDEAIVSYGSEAEARKWVSSADRSAHVTGHAVDIGPTDAALWLGARGSAYGLCQIYANEIWHFELATTPGGTCPEQLSDASAD